VTPRINVTVLISIITPTFNAEGTILETIQSALDQFSNDIEHLLIDAASSDQTLQIAKRYPHLRIISEKDRGIYDGMNKGARLSKGEWLLFLQGDDWLPPGALDVYREAIASNQGAQMICGGSEAVKKSPGGWNMVWEVSDSEAKKLSIENIALGEPMINARLIRRDVFHQLGGFSLDYSLASDRDFLLRAVESGVIQEQVNETTYRYRWHAGSSTMTEGNKLTKKLSEENLTIARNHLNQVNGVERDTLVKWHDRLTVQAAMNFLENFQWRDLMETVASGLSLNGLWVFLFSGELLRALPGFLARGFKSRSRVIAERNSV
jgi:glycosyltransferase